MSHQIIRGSCEVVRDEPLDHIQIADVYIWHQPAHRNFAVSKFYFVQRLREAQFDRIRIRLPELAPAQGMIFHPYFIAIQWQPYGVPDGAVPRREAVIKRDLEHQVIDSLAAIFSWYDPRIIWFNSLNEVLEKATELDVQWTLS
jgi:hypothetical protein